MVAAFLDGSLLISKTITMAWAGFYLWICGEM